MPRHRSRARGTFATLGAGPVRVARSVSSSCEWISCLSCAYDVPKLPQTEVGAPSENRDVNGKLQVPLNAAADSREQLLRPLGERRIALEQVLKGSRRSPRVGRLLVHLVWTSREKRQRENRPGKRSGLTIGNESDDGEQFACAARTHNCSARPADEHAGPSFLGALRMRVR